MRRYLVPGILLYLICSTIALAWADGLSAPIAVAPIGNSNAAISFPPQSSAPPSFALDGSSGAANSGVGTPTASLTTSEGSGVIVLAIYVKCGGRYVCDGGGTDFHQPINRQ